MTKPHQPDDQPSLSAKQQEFARNLRAMNGLDPAAARSRDEALTDIGAFVKQRKHQKLIVDRYKTSKGCADCGKSGPPAELWCPRNPVDRHKTTGSLIGRVPDDELRMIIKQRDVVCGPCHRRRRRDGFYSNICSEGGTE